MRKTKLLLAIALSACTAIASAQLEVRTEAQVTTATGDHNPLWLNANKYGLSSVDTQNGYLRAALQRPMAPDTARRWDYGYGADVAVAYNFSQTLTVQQAFVEARWMKLLLTVGAKQQPMQLKNQLLSSGSQTLGVNARPVPGVRLELPAYWDVPGLGGWLALKGHVAYGMQSDDSWQRDFTAKDNRYTEHTRLHTKAGYARIGRAGRPFTAELGLEMGCQYGGVSYVRFDDYVLHRIESVGGLKGAWHALVPGGYDATESDIVYKNVDGNHLGSVVARLNADYERWGLSAYVDHFFEDHSQMFFFSKDGYGSGPDWNRQVQSRYFVYDLRDALWGLELRLKQCRWLSDVVAEYIYTKYQSGPIYHDHTQNIADQIAGRDDYYNHFMFAGWQHWGQVMGNPLYRSPLYNDNQHIDVRNNRFYGFHLAAAGQPADGLSYRLLCSWQRGFGTYAHPLPQPTDNLSLLAELSYAPHCCPSLQGWTLKAAIGLDRGDLLGDNTGLQVTVARHLYINKKGEK